MKALILNHHFTQDINELLYYNFNKHEVKLVSPEYFANVAKEYFPDEVFGPDLSLYYNEKFSNSRCEYRQVAYKMVHNLYKIFQFDVFILPSDSFFYIRDVIDACKDLRIPIIVVQKELGVSKHSYDVHSKIIKKYYPVICDWMTTCSEYSKDFWVLAGCNTDTISVVGQPRFDFYFRNHDEDEKQIITKQSDVHLKKILFLAYDLNAYSEYRAEGLDKNPWSQLFEETIDELIKLSQKNTSIIYIKPHPQQDKDTLKKIMSKVQNYSNIILLPGNVDTRYLLIECEIIIGFQTTTILEALIIGKKVIYTFWTEVVNELKEQLLQFHKMSSCLSVAKSKEEFKYLINNSQDIIGGDNLSLIQINERRQNFIDLFGPVDGKSSERVWQIIENIYQNSVDNMSQFHRIRRLDILNDVERYRKIEFRTSLFKLATLKIINTLKIIPILGGKISKHITLIIKNEELRLKECQKPEISSIYIIGSTKYSIFKLLMSYLKNKKK